jgi:hypothetical protein
MGEKEKEALYPSIEKCFICGKVGDYRKDNLGFEGIEVILKHYQIGQTLTKDEEKEWPNLHPMFTICRQCSTRLRFTLGIYADQMTGPGQMSRKIG